MDKIKRHLLLFIIILASFLRILNLSSNPPSLNWDEISMGYSAYSVMSTGADEWGVKFPLLFRSYGEWKSPVYIYLIIPFIKIFGLNAWGVRLPAAIAGVIAVYLTYLIGKKLYSEQVGLWAAFLLAVSPWHLMLSRPGFEAGVALMLVLLGHYLFLRDKVIWSALPYGLAIHTYHSAKLVVPLLCIYLAIFSYRRLGIKKLLIMASILVFFAIPIATDFVTGKSQKRFAQVGITTDLELVERFFKYRNTLPLGDLGNKLVFNKATFLLSKGFSNWTSYLSPHFLLGSSSIRAQHSIPFRGVLYFAEFGLMLYGLVLILQKKYGLSRYLPLFMILIGFIPPALTKDAYHVLRSILTLPWWQILAALALVELQNNKKLLKLFQFTLALLTFEVAIFLFQYFAWYPKAFARDWQYGYKEMVTWVSAHEEQYKQIYVTKAYGEPQIFFAFYDRWDPKWYQEQNKLLLNYESLGYPWLDQLPEYSFGKYTFRDINWPTDNGKNETLSIGKGDDFWPDTPHPFQVKFPDGTVSFSASEGK